MPAPSTSDEFLDFLRRSSLLTGSQLDDYLQRLRSTATVPSQPTELANLLIDEGLLTDFQAGQILKGKFKGFSIGNYKVLRPLGAGGMASVYLAEHRENGSRVAIKVLPKAKAEDSAVLKRFHREGRVVFALDHPNIVHAYEIDQDEKLHFMVLEYVEGTSLQEIVKNQGALDIARAARYAYQVAQGLDHIHQMGLVHRDIKPGNLLVDTHDQIKIFDMGLARFFQDESDVLTRGVLGTADYIAPEQTYDSHAVDIRADIYGLGGTFYYLLAGMVPFGQGTVSQKIQWHRERQPEPIRVLRPEVPKPLSALVDKMMAKDPAERFQTPAELITALEAWIEV